MVRILETLPMFSAQLVARLAERIEGESESLLLGEPYNYFRALLKPD